jgi:hypothetical protein
MLVSLVWIKTDDRNLLSLGSVDLQTSQWQPITGTPWEVPVPKNVTLTISLFGFVQK